MTCAECIQRMSAWRDGTLTDAEARELEAHAASCERCGAELEVLSRVGSVAREIEPPPGLRDATLRAVERQRTRTRWQRTATGVAAIAALAFIAIALQPHRKSASDFPGAGRVLLAMDRARPEFAELDRAERDLDAAIAASPNDADLSAARQRVRRQRDLLQQLVDQVTK
jgi:anti-sigma factor RsiW